MNKIYYERPNNPRKKQEGKNSSDYMKQSEIEEQYYNPSYEANDYSKDFQTKVKNDHMKELITNGVLVVLSIFFVINFFAAFAELAGAPMSYANSEDSFWYKISVGQYAELVAESWNNQFMGVKETEGMRQCYAVMEYYEAASLYKVAVEKGNEEDKAKYASIMEDNLGDMSDIMYIAEDINALFDIK